MSGSRNSLAVFGQVGSCGSFKVRQSTRDGMERDGNWRGSGKLQQDRWAIFEEVFQLREPKAPKAFRRLSFFALARHRNTEHETFRDSGSVNYFFAAATATTTTTTSTTTTATATSFCAGGHATPSGGPVL